MMETSQTQQRKKRSELGPDVGNVDTKCGTALIFMNCTQNEELQVLSTSNLEMYAGSQSTKDCQDFQF
jgi:hypothetical protein